MAKRKKRLSRDTRHVERVLSQTNSSKKEQKKFRPKDKKK